MSYRTVEVELEDGRVRPHGTDTLPAKARALLTILTGSDFAETPAEGRRPMLAEVARHLAGIGEGKLTDLSTNPKHLD